MIDRPDAMPVAVAQPNAPVPSAPTHAIYSVSKLNREVRLLLESGIGQIWVQGEISNLARPSSGHWYFSLKDRDAQLRCAMFRPRNGLCRFTPREGQAVIAYGRVSLYEPRGDYQLLIEHLDDAGVGALQRAFDELKARLAAEGLFASERKRPLPLVPRRIGVITSPTGAAIRDVLHILARRFPAGRGADLSGAGAGRGGGPGDRRGAGSGLGARRVRRADSDARRRLARGSVGLQR